MSEQIVLKYREEDLRILEGFRLLDDDFMTMVFEENIEATELLLNIILERDDLRVTRVVVQKEEKNPIAGKRTIKLDIYAEDGEGKVYDVEIQRQDAGADVHRARFHSSVLDTRMLHAQQEFKELHDSYVIFITENDVLGKGLPLYHADRVIRETGEMFGDGSHIIYVNGAYKNDQDPIGKLMHDFRCTNAVDMFYPVLASQVRYFKETEGGRGKVCKAIEDTIKKRRIDILTESIKNLMESMKWTAEEAIAALKLSEDDKKQLESRV